MSKSSKLRRMGCTSYSRGRTILKRGHPTLIGAIVHCVTHFIGTLELKHPYRCERHTDNHGWHVGGGRWGALGKKS